MRAALLAVYYLVYAAVYSGWLFHRSVRPEIFGYSWGYFAFLLVMATPFVLPPALILVVRQVGRRRFLFAATPVIVITAVGYVGAAQFYYQTREHLFDPFLQNPAQRFVARVEPRRDDSLRIVAIGGSTTECPDLPPEERYPHLLEGILRKSATARDVTVFNAGKSWWTTKHSLINYVTYLRRGSPDVAVVMHAINDACQSFSPPQFARGDYDVQWSHYYGAAINGAAPPSFERRIAGRLFDTWYSSLTRPADVPLEEFLSLPMYRQHLTTLVEYLLADGVKVVLVTQPSIYKEEMSADELAILQMNRRYCRQAKGVLRSQYPDVLSMRRAMAAYNAVAAGVAERYEIPLVDAAAQVPRELGYFADDVHKTPAASRLLAELVGAKLGETGWLEPR